MLDRLIPANSTVKDALRKLDAIGVVGNVLFVVDEAQTLIGTVTDGDIRRGLLRDYDINDAVSEIANKKFRFARTGEDPTDIIKQCKKLGIRFLPLINGGGTLLSILDLNNYAGFLPVDAVIMAGGKGARLLPLTANQPKPMLQVGDKPILEHNIDRLIKFGVQNIYISINYLGEQIASYFQDGTAKGIKINYLQEMEPLGTIGSVTLADDYEKETILLMNSDILTNIDFEDFYNEYKNTDADMAVATTPYHVDVPYAVLEMNHKEVLSFQEKPRYTYYSNAGIYLLKKKLLQFIPQKQYFDATDLIQLLIEKQMKLVSYPILGYWLDIGRINDYLKAQEDIKHLKL